MESVRPPHCPVCGRAGAVAGGPITLVGHGTRERVMIGPLSAGGEPKELRIQLRRYRCRGCDAVVVSAPRGLLPRMLYGAVAVALSLALWAVEGQPGWRVRARIDPVARDGDYARWHGWRSLRRWAKGASRWWSELRLSGGGARERAAAVVTQLAARAAAATGTVIVLACEGALRS